MAALTVIAMLLEVRCQLALAAWKSYGTWTMMRWTADWISHKPSGHAISDMGAMLDPNWMLNQTSAVSPPTSSDGVIMGLVKRFGPALLAQGVQLGAGALLR